MSQCFETETTECIRTLQGHPRSFILVPTANYQSKARILLVLNSNVSAILPHFRDIRAFVRQNPLFPTVVQIREVRVCGERTPHVN